MPLHLEQVNWMPSPPLAPDDGPIDLEQLRRMTLGDEALEHEVLAMFSAQSARLIEALATMPPEAAAIAHTMKGSARAIGAHAVAEAAGRLEAAISASCGTAEALADLADAVALAQGAIDDHLKRS